jgi:hypothetical protein
MTNIAKTQKDAKTPEQTDGQRPRTRRSLPGVPTAVAVSCWSR